MITRRNLIALGGSAASAVVLSNSALAEKPPILLELFTSQGCSSCPPADALLGEFTKRSDVITLSFNVDYWDYLGWADTLAKSEFTKRQMDYARARGDGNVYTPQIVVNGKQHAVGSRKADLNAALKQSHSTDTPLKLSVSETEISVSVGASEKPWSGTVWLMAVTEQIEVPIERGENSGMNAVYHRVVRSLTPAGMYKGQAMTVALPRATVVLPDTGRLVVVLQEDMTGPVRGLSQLRLGKSS
jgi:hypothetical protein